MKRCPKGTGPAGIFIYFLQLKLGFWKTWEALGKKLRLQGSGLRMEFMTLGLWHLNKDKPERQTLADLTKGPEYGTE